jgi:hypothetical protein
MLYAMAEMAGHSGFPAVFHATLGLPTPTRKMVIFSEVHERQG